MAIRLKHRAALSLSATALATILLLPSPAMAQSTERCDRIDQSGDQSNVRNGPPQVLVTTAPPARGESAVAGPGQTVRGDDDIQVVGRVQTTPNEPQVKQESQNFSGCKQVNGRVVRRPRTS